MIDLGSWFWKFSTWRCDPIASGAYGAEEEHHGRSTQPGNKALLMADNKQRDGPEQNWLAEARLGSHLLWTHCSCSATKSYFTDSSLSLLERAAGSKAKEI